MKRIWTSILLVVLLIPSAYSERRMRILVYPFENQSRASYSWLSAGMTDSVIADLRNIGSVEAITDAYSKYVLKEIKSGHSDLTAQKCAVRVGKLTGADIIFAGSYTVGGGKVRVVTKLVNVETGRTVKSITLEGTLENIFDLQDRIVFVLMDEAQSVKVAGTMKVVITDNERSGIKTKQRPKLTAYQNYAKGLEILDTDPAGALRLFNEALAVEPEYVDALLAAGYTTGYSLNRFTEGLAYLEKANDLLKKLNQFENAYYARLLIRIGMVYDKKGNLNRALEYYGKSIDVFDHLGLQNTANYAASLMFMGTVYFKNGDIDRALEYNGQSRDVYDRLGLQHTDNYALLLMKMGFLYDKNGELDRAMEYYGNSRNVFDHLGLQNTANYAFLLMNMGIIYKEKRELDLALEYYGKSRDVYDRLGLQNTVRYALLLYYIADDYEKKGQKEAAGRLYRKSYETYQKAGYEDEWKDEVRKNAERLGY